MIWGFGRMNKNDRIKELEAQVAEIKLDNENITELMLKLTREMSELYRKVSHLLPEE